MTDPFTITVEEVCFRLNRLMGWIKIVSAACDMSTAALESGATSEQIGTEREIDDNAMRLVRAEIRKRELERPFVGTLFKVLGLRNEYDYPKLDLFWSFVDAQTDLQARCALKVLEEGGK